MCVSLHVSSTSLQTLLKCGMCVKSTCFKSACFLNRFKCLLKYQISDTGQVFSYLLICRILHSKKKNTTSVVFALVRWMSPHPNAMLRDSEKRPVCPPPFDLNHALWTFTKLPGRRDSFSDAHVMRQLDLFPGSDRASKLDRASTFERARYDLVELDSIDKFMNCTTIDDDTDTILETITLPFAV